jgi:methylenetetrahydrofolate reductase (NADPH)
MGAIKMTKFSTKLSQGEFVITTELTPPKGTDLSNLLKTAGDLKNHVDAFNITDSHNARMSLSPLAAASALVQAGLDPILQMTTRDRNRIALQSDMLGAGYLGVENLVCMGGDPPHLGDHPDAKPVFDFSTLELLDAASKLTTGVDSTGNKLNASPVLNIGAVVNPGADNLDKEIERLKEKIDNGARFFQTQAIFDKQAFENFCNRVATFNLPMIAGILPVKSAKMAAYMNSNVPGINVPDDIIAKISSSGQVKVTSTEISAAIIRDIRPYCAGVHLMAIGWEALIPAILEQAGVR